MSQPQHRDGLQSVGSEVHRRCACDDAVMSLDSTGYVSRIIVPSEIKMEVQIELSPTEDLITALKNPDTRSKCSKAVMQILSYMLKESARQVSSSPTTWSLPSRGATRQLLAHSWKASLCDLECTCSIAQVYVFTAWLLSAVTSPACLPALPKPAEALHCLPALCMCLVHLVKYSLRTLIALSLTDSAVCGPLSGTQEKMLLSAKDLPYFRWRWMR